MIAEASIKTEIKVVILSQKLFSSVKYNALLVPFFILSRTKFIDVTYWHDGTSWRLMFKSLSIFDDDFDVVVMWILILSFLVMWRLSIELKHAYPKYYSTLSNNYKKCRNAKLGSNAGLEFRGWYTEHLEPLPVLFLFFFPLIIVKRIKFRCFLLFIHTMPQSAEISSLYSKEQTWQELRKLPVTSLTMTTMTVATMRKWEVIWGSWMLFTRKLEVIWSDVLARSLWWIIINEWVSECHM